MTETRYVTDEAERYSLYRLCHCTACNGLGKVYAVDWVRCRECRGEGRIRQELASCGTPEAVGVALVTLAREGEWLDGNGDPCAFGLLDRKPECERCEGEGNAPTVTGRAPLNHGEHVTCPDCKGSGVKPTGTWLLLPWMPSARNVSDAGRVLARSKKPH